MMHPRDSGLCVPLRRTDICSGEWVTWVDPNSKAGLP